MESIIDNVLKNIVSEISSNQLFFTIILSIILLFLGYFFKDPISKIIEGISFDSSSKMPSAKSHYVFSSLEAAKIGIDSMEIKDHPEKSKMMRDCLRTMCEGLNKNLKTIVFNENNYKNSTLKLQSNIDKMLLESIKDFNTNLKAKYREQGLSMRDTSIIFQAIESTRRGIRGNVMREIYKAFATGYNLDNNAIIVCILTVISASCKYMLDGFVKDFEDMNGAFDKYYWNDEKQIYLMR